eukprot:304883-Heterocapsa_arctica.AAC.1
MELRQENCTRGPNKGGESPKEARPSCVGMQLTGGEEPSATGQPGRWLPLRLRQCRAASEDAEEAAA